MKAKIYADPNSNEISIDYVKVAKKDRFRFEFFRRVMDEVGGDIVICIDTNLNMQEHSLMELIQYLLEKKIHFNQICIPHRQTGVFGSGLRIFAKSKKAIAESVIVMQISKHEFQEELFDMHLKMYDLAIGLNSQVEFSEIFETFADNADALLFNKQYFQEFIYDSVSCERLKSSYNTAHIAREI